MNARDRRLQRRAREQQRKNRPQPSELVYITRSFSRKLNLGNYESADCFCSLNLQCFAEDAAEKSQAAVEWCKNQVQADVKRFRGELGPLETEKHPVAKANAAAFEAHQRANGKADDRPPWIETDQERTQRKAGKPSPLQQKINQDKF